MFYIVLYDSQQYNSSKACEKYVFPAVILLIGSSSKLTRRPRGGGQQANFYSEGLKAKWIHSALDIIHSLIEWKFECDRLLSPAASVCKSSLLNEDAMSMLKPFMLLFWGNVSY